MTSMSPITGPAYEMKLEDDGLTTTVTTKSRKDLTQEEMDKYTKMTEVRLYASL